VSGFGHPTVRKPFRKRSFITESAEEQGSDGALDGEASRWPASAAAAARVCRHGV
jgi:hypothetical protein